MFRPMLSATLLDPERLTYPVFVSPKLDGIRCVIKDGKALSRNLKPIRNDHVQRMLTGLPDGLDGELIVGSSTDGHVLNRTQSGVMSAEGTPQFKYYVFDNFGMSQGFEYRLTSLEDIRHSHIEVVPHYTANSVGNLLNYEQLFLDEGYEGLMVRSIGGAYKYGRSTTNEGLLFKFKRFRDGEAIVFGLREGVHNQNEATTDALGRTKRSNHQTNKIGSCRVGTIMAVDRETGQPLEISPGRMTADQRKFYWEYPEQIMDRIIKYKTFDYGTLNVPRFSTFQAFRDPADMS